MKLKPSEELDQVRPSSSGSECPDGGAASRTPKVHLGNQDPKDDKNRY